MCVCIYTYICMYIYVIYIYLYRHMYTFFFVFVYFTHGWCVRMFAIEAVCRCVYSKKNVVRLSIRLSIRMSAWIEYTCILQMYGPNLVRPPFKRKGRPKVVGKDLSYGAVFPPHICILQNRHLPTHQCEFNSQEFALSPLPIWSSEISI